MPPPIVRRRGLAPPAPDPSPAGRPPPARRRKIIPGTFGELAASPPSSSILHLNLAQFGDDFAKNNGVLLVLLETPSGFAVFYFCGIYLYLPDAMQSMWVKFANYYRARRVVWLKEFQTFDDKSSAINADTGVNKQLTGMILKWRRPGQELLVGKLEYKSVIESSLGIPCRHDELVMELMWGMKRFMPSLVRREKSELPKEDLLPVSQGLQMLLSSYGFDVKPEMVNDQIVATASVLFDCDAAEKKQYRDFHALGRHLKNVSGIEYENWDLLELATAFKIICSREIGDPDEMLSEDVQTKLLDDADKYEKKINKLVCMLRHHEVVSNYEIKTRHKDMLANLVKKAKEALVP